MNSNSASNPRPCSIGVPSVFYVCSIPKSLRSNVCSMCSMFLFNKGYKEIYIRVIGSLEHIYSYCTFRTRICHFPIYRVCETAMEHGTRNTDNTNRGY